MNTNTIEENLAQIGTFESLSEEDRIAIAGICQPLVMQKNDVLAREDLDADRLFALLDGKVGIWVEHGTVTADLIAITEAPSLVGEMSVADELPRSATIVALTDISGYSIEADAFRQLLRERGAVALALMKGLSRIVRSSNDSFISELRERNKELTTANSYLKKAQKQLLIKERLSSLGKVASMIMHDLRNPLSVIKAYADMLELQLEGEGRSDSNELKRCTSQIRRETIRLTGLTNEWLDYSQGEIHLDYTPTKTKTLFKQLSESIGATSKAKNVSVTWNNEFPDVVFLDNDRMLRVLINLYDNALKACSKLGNITISALRVDDGLALVVQDDGIGMDKETTEHVFDPFYSRSTYGGTGWGMHIVKTIVEAHKGTVRIKSEPNQGTEVTILLPLHI